MVSPDPEDATSRWTLSCAGVPKAPREGWAERWAEDELDPPRAPESDPESTSESELLKELAAFCSEDKMPRAERRAGIATRWPNLSPPAVAGELDACAEDVDVKVSGVLARCDGLVAIARKGQGPKKGG